MTLALDRGYERRTRYVEPEPDRSEISVSFEKYPLEIGDTVVEYIGGEVYIRAGIEPGSWEFDRIIFEPMNYRLLKVTLPEAEGRSAFQYLTRNHEFVEKCNKASDTWLWGE